MRFLLLKRKVRVGAMAVFCLLLLGMAHSTSPVKKKAKFRVGVVLSLTGPASEQGKEVRSGIEMAYEELKAAGRAPWELIFEDDASDATQATRVVRSLLAKGIQAFLGPLSSASVNAVAPLVERAHVPLVSPTATDVTVTAQRSYVFRVALDEESQAAALGRYAHRVLGASTAVIWTDSGSESARRQGQAFSRAFKQAGGRVFVESTYATGTLDFVPMLKKLAPHPPDVIFLPGTAVDAGRAIGQSQTLNLQSIFMGGELWDRPKFFELAGKGAIGHLFASHWSVQDPDMGSAAFVRSYSLTHGKPPSSAVALGYDATRLLAEGMAVAQIGALEKTVIQEAGLSLRGALEKIRRFPAVTGLLSIGENHLTRKPVIIRETQLERATFKARAE